MIVLVCINCGHGLDIEYIGLLEFCPKCKGAWWTEISAPSIEKAISFFRKNKGQIIEKK